MVRSVANYGLAIAREPSNNIRNGIKFGVTRYPIIRVVLGNTRAIGKRTTGH